MKTRLHDMDELLVKYLTGEATAAEQEAVQQWLQAADANRQYFDHFRLIWEESLRLGATMEVDEQQAWERFQLRTQNNPVKRTGRLLSIGHTWMRVAAILILVAGLGWIGWLLLKKDHSTKVSLTGLSTRFETKSDTLPDGSFVTLNQLSSLSWHENFTGNLRMVLLRGEAFFQVVPDQTKPFVVHTRNDIFVEVKGTSFNVKEWPSYTEIIVETGKVRILWKEYSAALNQGEKVIIDHRKGIRKKEQVTDKLYNYYHSRVFECDNTPLWKLADALNEAYNVKIIFGKESLRNEVISTTFKNQSLDSILNIISATFGITVIKENGTIILR